MKPQVIHKRLDARGLLCPMPVLRAKKAIEELKPGEVLEVLATDKGSVADFPAWCAHQRHTLLHWEQDGEVYRYYIVKGS